MTQLDARQLEHWRSFRAFVDEHVAPIADRMDEAGATPNVLIEKLGAQGYLGALVPEQYGGCPLDSVSFGLLCHELGRTSASLLSLLTVHSMVCRAIARWGSPGQRARMLPRLACGEALGALAVSEPDAGSDPGGGKTTIVSREDRLFVSGRKKWISYAQVASCFLVLGKWDDAPTTLLISSDSEGFECLPIAGMLGFRAAQLGELVLDACPAALDDIVGRKGFGFSHVIGSALDLGRYCIAWGSVGLTQGCVDLSVQYAADRQQGGRPIGDYQLIQRMLTDMLTDVRAASALCLRAGELRELGDPDSVLETSIAKYLASRTATRVSADALQLHGAHGCGPSSPVQRLFRDARIMEVIEGSSQIQQVLIANAVSQQRSATQYLRQEQ